MGQPLQDDLIYYTNRIQVSLKGSSGIKTTYATGLWAVSQNTQKLLFITNRHVIDDTFNPEMKKHGYIVDHIDVELRKFNQNSPLNETGFFDLVSPQKKIYYPQDQTDLAAIEISMKLTNLQNATKSGFRPNALDLNNEIADGPFFKSELKIMDSVSFVGFPNDLYDTKANIPIARQAAIASRPGFPFTGKAVTGEVILVSGLSLGGSSGSPVISNEVGIKATGVGRYLPRKFIGIMSGHLFDDKKDHVGLSYFIKSTEILRFLKSYGLN